MSKIDIFFEFTFEGPYPTSLSIGALELATNRHPGRPFLELDKMVEKYGDIVLLRGGFLTQNVVLVADPKVMTVPPYYFAKCNRIHALTRSSTLLKLLPMTTKGIRTMHLELSTTTTCFYQTVRQLK